MHPIEITRGTPATIRVHSDTYAAVVSYRPTEKTLFVKRVRDVSIKRAETGGYGWDREASNEDLHAALASDAIEHRFTLRKNGRWVEAGQSMTTGRTLGLGVAREYRNPHF